MKIQVPYLRNVWPFVRRSQHSVRAYGFVWLINPDAAQILGDGPPPIADWIASGLAEQVKANDQRTVYRVSLPKGIVYLKRCQVHRPRAWLRELVRPPKAQLEFEMPWHFRVVVWPQSNPWPGQEPKDNGPVRVG